MGGVALRREEILGVILAGGQSRRFGQDKAVASLGQRSLIEHVLARAMPQVGAMAISGRDYGLGVPVIADMMPSEGPLGGILSSLAWAREKGFGAIASFACDAPFFPADLVAQLTIPIHLGATSSYARSLSGRHPVFAIWPVGVTAELAALYGAGLRALKAAQDQLSGVPVAFPEGPAPGGDMFFNINRQVDQAMACHWLEAGDPFRMRAPSQQRGGPCNQ